eukprot:TRINITY_DN33330_c0_g1_i1.p1 TRINITY_DN33330_c0_g1~~TRINITY_DN33330_c0_g1_i1.p1  ORF type:complete len:226 (+),score=56.15 TRINITY_DN33330_c0_g1_i1:80-679(+)
MADMARELSRQIRTEQGLEKGVAAFYKYLPFDARGRWWVTVVENQRWFPIIGWSMTMALGDPPAFSDATGLQQRRKEGFPCPLGWQWEEAWEVVEQPGCKDGFMYATSFKGPWRDTPGSRDTVRRRTWKRCRMPSRTVAAPSRIEQLEHENRVLRAMVQSQSEALQRFYASENSVTTSEPHALQVDELGDLDWDVDLAT